MGAWFRFALLIWTISTSYDQKRVTYWGNSNMNIIISLRLKFQMTITLGHPWPMRFCLQQSNGLGALFKSIRQCFFWKCDLKVPNMCFWLSIWPNGHRESQKYEFLKLIPRTNEATGLIVLSPNSAQKHAFFRSALLIRPRKYMN